MPEFSSSVYLTATQLSRVKLLPRSNGRGFSVCWPRRVRTPDNSTTIGEAKNPIPSDVHLTAPVAASNAVSGP